MKLSKKQSTFCREYIVDLNATQAAIRAGYSKNTAKSVASENLTKPDIREQIFTLINERNMRLQIDADSVLKDLVLKMSADLADIFDSQGAFLPIDKWPIEWRRGLVAGVEIKQEYIYEESQRMPSGVVTKVRLADRTRILELVGRHVGIQAWKDNAKVDVVDDRLVEKLNAALKRAGVKSGC